MIDNTICTYFTHAGNVSASSASAVSPLPLARRAAAVAAAGFAGIGFGRDDIVHLLNTLGAAEINCILDDHGLHLRELEVLANWSTRGDRRRESDAVRAELLDAAAKIGARHIKVVGDLSGEPQSMDQLVDAFGELCEQASAVGTAITIELYPTSNLADLQTGFALVEKAGCANGGLLLDIWHMLRGHVQLGAIASLPPGIINHVELDDGTLLPAASYFIDTRDNRVECGEGEFPVREFVRAVRATGYAGPWGAEILSNAYREMAVEEATQRALHGIVYALGDD